jgi:hypothetical protein
MNKLINAIDYHLKHDFIYRYKNTRAYFWKEGNGHYVAGFIMMC